MYKIAALNDINDASNIRQEHISKSVPSKEALEATAHSDHRAAIQLLSRGEDERAHITFIAVLNNSYVAKVAI